MAVKDPPACPVDHKTRTAYLAQARAANDPLDALPPKTWTQLLASYLPSSEQPTTPDLNTTRVISTIPRSPTTSTPSAPSNHEIESDMDPSGKWVYPSEKMFFDAMKRKGYDAHVSDMKTVVPIHNAVNERAWQQIREWEAPYLSQSR